MKVWEINTFLNHEVLALEGIKGLLCIINDIK
jgi:hypothetical protein